jgi:hypothetical protein
MNNSANYSFNQNRSALTYEVYEEDLRNMSIIFVSDYIVKRMELGRFICIDDGFGNTTIYFFDKDDSILDNAALDLDHETGELLPINSIKWLIKSIKELDPNYVDDENENQEQKEKAKPFFTPSGIFTTAAAVAYLASVYFTRNKK